jgi:hypothetical protein
MVAFVAGRDSPPDAGLRGDFEEDITAYFQAARGRDLARDARVLYELAFARDEVTAHYRELVAAIAESKENHDLFYKESKARTKWSDASIDDDHIQVPVEVRVSGGPGGD